jgi:hypothetical protein
MISAPTTAFYISLRVPVLVRNQRAQSATDRFDVVVDPVDVLTNRSNITLYLGQSIQHLIGPQMRSGSSG